MAAAGQQCRGRCVKQSVCTEACTGLSGPMQARAGQRRTERGGAPVSERRAEMPGPAGRRPRDRALRCGCVSDPTPGGMAMASGVRALAGMGKTRGILPISTSLPAVILAASGWPGARALISGVAPARCRETLRSLGRHGVRCLPEAGALVWGLSGQGMAQAGTPAPCQPSEGRATDMTEYGGCLRVRPGDDTDGFQWCGALPKTNGLPGGVNGTRHLQTCSALGTGLERGLSGAASRPGGNCLAALGPGVWRTRGAARVFPGGGCHCVTKSGAIGRGSVGRARHASHRPDSSRRARSAKSRSPATSPVRGTPPSAGRHLPASCPRSGSPTGSRRQEN